MSAYIFDFDGTIADSFSLACRILLNHSDYLGCKQLTSTELLMLKELHAREVLKYIGIPFWRIASFVKKIRKMSIGYADQVNVFPEWQTILSSLNDKKHHVGLISSNSYQTVEFILDKYKLTHLFDFISCEHPLFGKKRVLKKIIRQKNLLLESTYYIGDEVRDIEAAHAAQIQSIAVGWGFNSSSRLMKALPHQLILNFDQLEHVLASHHLE